MTWPINPVCRKPKRRAFKTIVLITDHDRLTGKHTETVIGNDDMNPVDKLKALSKAPQTQEAMSDEPATNVTTQPAVKGVDRLKALSKTLHEQEATSEEPPFQAQEPTSEEAATNAITTQPAVQGVDKLKAIAKTLQAHDPTSEEATNTVTTQPAVKGLDKLKAIAKTLEVKRTTEHPAAIPAGTEQTMVDDEKVRTTPATRGTTAHVVNLKLEESCETPPATQGATGQSLKAVGQVKKKGRGSGSRGSLAARLFTIVGLCLKFSCRIIYAFCKAALWTVPRYAYQRYRRISSRKVRHSIALSALLVTGVGVFFIWPEPEQETWSEPERDVRSEPRKKARSEPGSDVRSEPEKEVQSEPEREVQSEPGKEVCEFLARPAAKLFIDGKLASEEVPPIYRTQLELGEHTIRFVSPGNRTHEIRIDVVKALPTQWFMNFVEGRVDERPLSSEKEAK